MAVVRKLLLVALAAGALYGVQACASETELNPQPLPPEDPRSGQTPGADETADKGASSGGGGSSGTSGAPNAGLGDAGADGDAADGGGG